LRSEYASPLANIGRFDFGICMVAYDGREIVRSKEFDHDVENKVFTLHRADNVEQLTYSMRRYGKITAGRYAGWKLAIPDRFEGLVKAHDFARRWYLDDNSGKGLHGGSVLRPKERLKVNA
jgi:hypothetical protein